MHELTSEILRNLTVLENLSEGMRERLLLNARIRRYPRGSTLSLQGDGAASFKIVMSGWVKLFRISLNGNEAILEMLNLGQSFDEIASLLGGCSLESAEALSDCSLMHIDMSKLYESEHDHKELSRLVMFAASRHLNSMASQIEQLKARTGAQRLSMFLIEQSDVKDIANEVTLPYAKCVIAGILGMKPETLSRAFNRLKSMGVICEREKVSIGDLSALKAFSTEDIADVRATA